MQLSNRWIVLVLIIASLGLSACTNQTQVVEAGISEPATVEHLEGVDVTRITLSDDAAKRLDIQTVPVSEAQGAGNGTKFMIMPYAALLYDTEGKTWTYTNSDPLIFVRSPVGVDHIEGDQVFLADGPPAGMLVVTVGAAQLYGSETEFEEE